ncbi:MULTISPECIES: FKBP-type peptidyl-prolyl cis-trans isomerase [Corallincola]|uniref:Peptidyl-prolyl cis-trans isomerase n=2 Tax=Corallincola TaxID=1775176 RepID=A0ABY1WKT5_9GAMM|nr:MULTISPECIES: FKBP-type peptidyl-prolyl cis-trans isomerase [Corallincola]TAA40388.1 FKBP-type peptidyl-prolyl cis-trans isomerase [Corallincola spongiicola]TCI05302.1 FKBP-type peptidyl-prolyl cis-trans isomerase [Corallincola luteus]
MSEATYSTPQITASYGVGRNLGEQLKQNPFEGMDLDAVVDGIRSAFAGEASVVTDEEMEAAFRVIQEQMQAQAQAQHQGAISEGENFLTENAKRDEVTVTESGLQYEVLEAGDGEKPTASSTVRTHYHGTLITGDVFDSSYQRGEPAEFPVGGVIRGWTEALQMMPVGSKWRLYVPYDLAYGERGAGGAIGPYQTLIFDVELLDILA